MDDRMMALWRTWLRAVAMITMLIGCNTVAPLAVASSAAPAIEVAGCHETSKTRSGAVLVCKMSCAALPAAIQAFEPPAAGREEFEIPALRPLSGEALRPEAPPPRWA